MIAVVRLVLFVLLALRRSSSVQSRYIYTPGDVIFGGLFPVHKEGSKENLCGPFNEIPGYQYMEAMLYALEKINNRTDVLPGIKLGTIIYDTCRSPTISADKTKDFIKHTLSPEKYIGELAGVIGPFTSGNSIIVANFLRVFEIPQISYASLSVQLSDKDIYNYFFRTVPPDSFFAEALAELLKRLGWTYVSIIYSLGTYPETGTSEVIKALTKKDICVAKKHRLPRFPEEEDFDQAINEVVSVEEANVVVFVTIQRDSRELLMAKKRQSRAKRLSFVGSVSWSNRDDITKGLGDVADGTITFGHMEGNNAEFEEYFRSLNLSNYNASYKGWFEEFWQKQFNCFLGNASEKYSKRCSGKESLLTEHMEIAPVRVVINAVYAMAYALHNMQKRLCPDVTGLCQKMTPLSRTMLQKFLKNTTFPDSSFKWPLWFDQNNEVEGNYTVLNFRNTGNGVYRYVPVGTWTSKMQENGEITGWFNMNFSDLVWSNGNPMVPLSICSSKCDNRSIQVGRPGYDSKCCWDCEKCGRDEIIWNNTCEMCSEGLVPNTNYTSCSKLELKYINMDTPLAIFLVFFSCLGIVADLTVFAVFFANRQHHLIKASGREMCYFMFVGIFVVFMVPLCTLAKPTESLCYFQRFIMGISFTICYAPLLMKIWRIHRIFKSAEELRRLRGLIGRRSQIFITVGLITVQGLFCVLIFSTDPPDLKEHFHQPDEQLVLECSLNPSVFVAYLVYNVVLMFLCTIYAFLTRNFPKNFNEAMYIGVTLYLTCVVWVVFFACFLNISHSFSQLYFISGACVVIGWITLVGLYAPKVYHLYTRGEFDLNNLMLWNSSVSRRSESRISEAEEQQGKSTQNFITLNPMAIERKDVKSP